MNKQAKEGPLGFVLAVFLAIGGLIFLSSGGFGSLVDLSKVISDIPPILWVFIGIILLVLFRGKK